MTPEGGGANANLHDLQLRTSATKPTATRYTEPPFLSVTSTGIDLVWSKQTGRQEDRQGVACQLNGRGHRWKRSDSRKDPAQMSSRRGPHRLLTQVVQSVQIRGVFHVVLLEELEIE